MSNQDGPRSAFAPRDLAPLAIFAFACLAVAGIAGMVTAASVHSWYPTLRKPPFNPPDWLFAPVWTVLYIAMAIAGWRVWRQGAGRRAAPMILYAAQLALNFVWSILFFGAHLVGAALVDILALLILILLTAFAFWRIDRLAGILFGPYAAWVGFASLLNFAIWRLN